MPFCHNAVMSKPVIDFLSVAENGRCLDGTVGGGGHAERILEGGERIHLLGIDRDGEAIAAAGARLQRFSSRVHLFRGCYSQMADFAAELEWETVDAVLLDIGVSSPQLDNPRRGFSFRHDGPLDMRMDTRGRVTGASVLNHKSEADLADIFRSLGEERRAREVARAVVERRRSKPWERTGEFAELIEKIVGRGGRRGLPPATRCFQALRIAVNGELDELSAGLEAAVDLLGPGGRLVVIAFHSLEDRIVKNFMRYQAAACVCPPDFPVCRCGKQATLRILTRRPVRPDPEEVRVNSRAGSAKLRAAEKLAAPEPDE